MSLIKYTIEEVRDIFEKRGYKLLSDKYKNKDKNMTCIDKEGYFYYTSYASMRDNKAPLRTSKSNPYSMYNIKKWVFERFPQCYILDDEYVNNRHKIKIYCILHDEIHKVSWDHIQRNRCCRKCGIEKRSGESCNLWNGGEVEFDCEICGNKSKTNKAHYERNVHHYCSKECANIGFSRFFSKENSPMWDKNKSEEERLLRRSYQEYKDFVKKVLSRDNYKCVLCGKKGTINVHHKDGYNWCTERRLDVDNGITLCEQHHNDFHDKYGRGDNTEEQFNEWLGSVECE